MRTGPVEVGPVGEDLASGRVMRLSETNRPGRGCQPGPGSIAPSLRYPPVTTAASGRPRPSTAWWILVLNPPRTAVTMTGRITSPAEQAVDKAVGQVRVIRPSPLVLLGARGVRSADGHG